MQKSKMQKRGVKCKNETKFFVKIEPQVLFFPKRIITVHHYRDGKELPPILSDIRYDSSFQGRRRLRSPVYVKPGDIIVAECVYNTDRRTQTTLVNLSLQYFTSNSFINASKFIFRG